MTGLIWLKDPTCLDGDVWAGDNRAAAALAEGACGLSDRSQPGDWRLPTKAEWEATVAEAVRRGCVGDDAPSWTDDEGARCYSDGTSSSSFAGIVPGGYTTSSAVETAPHLAWTATLLSGGVVPVPAKVFGATNAWPVRNGR